MVALRFLTLLCTLTILALLLPVMLEKTDGNPFEILTAQSIALSLLGAPVGAITMILFRKHCLGGSFLDFVTFGACYLSGMLLTFFSLSGWMGLCYHVFITLETMVDTELGILALLVMNIGMLFALRLVYLRKFHRLIV